ncbi:MAG: thioesterase family protein [bacterium]|nr:thioesterase family protein [bacterium]
MPQPLKTGRSYQSQERVEEWMTAAQAGNPGVEVLSTPMLLQMIEVAAAQCVTPCLEAGQASVGTAVDVQHIAATPVGMIVRAEAEIVTIEGRRVTFAVAAFDEREKIAEGTHERVIVDRSAFLERVAEKQAPT